ncbi:MAG: histidine kinase [Prolixibacteraceae bacterium]|nr:histidine kinase [Prolixibacteraceae bacterium]
MRKHLETGIWLLLWLLVFISPMLVSYARNNYIRWEPVFGLWRNMLPYLILSLINHYLLVPYFFFRKKAYYFISLAITLALFALALYQLEKANNEKHHKLPREELRALPPGSGTDPGFGFSPPQSPGIPRRNNPRMINNNRPPLLSNLPPYITSLILALLILGFDTGMRAIFRWMKIERENLTLEKEKIKSELAFLRNQVSPHFFMNTLNNIHSLIDVDTEEAKEALIRLSKMMRHLLYESEQNKIALKKEIDFIQSYIDLMKLRFTDKVKINFTANNYNPEVEIHPLLFTSLIENAFKHGISYLEDSFIDIELTTNDEMLIFNIKNSIAPPKQEQKNSSNAGIGLENTRKRFDLLYKEDYQMNITQENGIFSIKVKLPL